MTTALALDVGGTKLAAALVDDDGTVRERLQVPARPTDDGEGLWDAVADLLDEVASGARYDAVGVGCGGPMRWPQGEVSPLNIPGWRGFPLLDRVRQRYADGRPAAIHNDAVAVALAEARWGAGAGAGYVLGMVVSTGVGAGVVAAGRPYDGATGNAGHLGHVVVDPTGPSCVCGGRGCLEAIARGPAIASYAVGLGWEGEPNAAAVADGARAGNASAQKAFQRAGRAVGTALASAAALLDLDVVCVGGGVALAWDLLEPPLREAWATYAGMEFVRRCRIVPAALGADAGLAGAAALVLPVT